MRNRWIVGALVGALALLSAAAAEAAPKVVVTLKPLHSLVAAVMEGVAAPALLLPAATSPHVYSLRPSDTRVLAGADMVVWAGPDLETFLAKALATVVPQDQLVTLAEQAGLILLPLRAGGAYGEDEHGHGSGLDMHFWLDVANAERIVTFTAALLSERDPENTGRYWANRERTLASLAVLDRELRESLAPARGRPFLVLHDAFQYWEARYGLRDVGALMVNPDRVPGAKTLVRLRAAIAEAKVACIFGEPQFPPALARTLTDGTGATLVVVDALGVDVPAGPGAYAATLRGLAQAFRGCLAPGP